MFATYKSHNNNLYNNLVKLSRNIFFYKDLDFKDNFETRIILIFLHFSIVIEAFRIKKKGKFPQKIYDNIFTNIEYHLRELGYGDIAVNKKMKLLNKIFYNILLKISDNKSSVFKINTSILEEYFNSKDNDKANYASKLSDYFENFYNFCFELDSDTMIEGKINYKI